MGIQDETMKDSVLSEDAFILIMVGQQLVHK